MQQKSKLEKLTIIFCHIFSEKLRPGPPKLLEPKTSARDIILMWLPPDDGVFVREYVIGWGESGPYEETVRVSNDAQYYRIEDLGEWLRFLLFVSHLREIYLSTFCNPRNPLRHERALKEEEEVSVTAKIILYHSAKCI